MKCKQFNKFVANIDTLTSDQRKILDRVMNDSPAISGGDWRDTLSKDTPVLCYVADHTDKAVSVIDCRWVYEHDNTVRFKYTSFNDGEKRGFSTGWKYALPVDRSIWTEKDWDLYNSI